MNKSMAVELDMQLLRTFVAVLETGSVSRAAEIIGSSQPTVSHGLNRLRQVLQDPLFVRVNNRMQPTPRAQELREPIQQMLAIFEGQVLRKQVFDAASSQRLFTFCMTDIGEIHYVPPVVQMARSVAPRVRFRVLSLPPDRTEAALENGEADLAVGYFPDLSKSGFYQQQLSTSSFVCIGRRGNPHLREQLTLQGYLDAPHVMVSASVRSQEVLSHALDDMGLLHRLNVVLMVPHFLTLLSAVTQTDLIASVPQEAAAYLQRLAPLQLKPLPFEAPVFALRQHWHRRYHHDPANQWLRKLIADRFQAGAAQPGCQ